MILIETKYCGCGCGTVVMEAGKFYRYSRSYILGHQNHFRKIVRSRRFFTCACGCGTVAEDTGFYRTQRFITGHNGKGVVFTEMRKQRISNALKGNVCGRGNKGRASPMLGKHHSQETKDKIGAANAIALKGSVPWNKQAIEVRYCACKCGNTFQCKTGSKQKYLNGHRVRVDNVSKRPEVKAKLSKSMEKSWRLGLIGPLTDEQRKAATTKALRTMREAPTSYERRLLELISKHNLPFKFVGDGAMWITSEGKHMNPDFVNVNGSKVVIEVFEDAWKKLQYGSVEQFKADRSRRFGKFGWVVVYLNREDLFREDWETHCLDAINQGNKEFERLASQHLAVA